MRFIGIQIQGARDAYFGVYMLLERLLGTHKGLYSLFLSITFLNQPSRLYEGPSTKHGILLLGKVILLRWELEADRDLGDHATLI